MNTFFLASAEQHENEEITTFCVIAALQRRTRRSGGEYISLSLADRSGRIDAKAWDGLEQFTDLRVNDVVKIRGMVGSYAGRPQITIAKIRKALEDEVVLEDLLPTTSKDINSLWIELNDCIDSVHDDDVRRLLKEVFADKELASLFAKAPAAQTFHHAWIGGLLEHVVSLCYLCGLAQAHYSWINRDLLIAGALLHDIGKIHELGYTVAIHYTDEGQLLGHISMGVQILHQAADRANTPKRLTIVLEHLILSHHGEKAHGSPVEPVLPESYLLHLLDNIDAKLTAIYSALEQEPDLEVWTKPVPVLRKPIIKTGNYLKK